MNLHEYQAKELMRRHGVPVPAGEPATSVEEAKTAIEKLFGEGHQRVVVKSQIHAGGRGKGTFKNGFQGGVHLADSVEDATAKAEAMFGNVLVTKQTGEEGKQVNRLLITSCQEIKSEFYCAVLLDRALGKPIIMASSEGGVDIEEVAEATPEKIIKETVDPDLGLQAYQGRKIAIASACAASSLANVADCCRASTPPGLVPMPPWWKSTRSRSLKMKTAPRPS